MSEEKNNTNKSEKVKWIRGNRRFCVDDPCSCCLGKEVFDEVFKECIEINNTEVRMIYINLKEHLDDEIKILSGREFGKEHREKFNFNRLDNSKDVINIIIPDDIYGLNSSYFLNLFGSSIRKLGENKFREKYNFQCDEVIMSSIEEYIKIALKKSDVLMNALEKPTTNISPTE